VLCRPNSRRWPDKRKKREETGSVRPTPLSAQAFGPSDDHGSRKTHGCGGQKREGEQKIRESRQVGPELARTTDRIAVRRHCRTGGWLQTQGKFGRNGRTLEGTRGAKENPGGKDCSLNHPTEKKKKPIPDLDGKRGSLSSRSLSHLEAPVFTK